MEQHDGGEDEVQIPVKAMKQIDDSSPNPKLIHHDEHRRSHNTGPQENPTFEFLLLSLDDHPQAH